MASPDPGPHPHLAARSSHDLSTSGTMARQGVICIPILSLMPDEQQKVAKLNRQLDSACLLAVGELVRSPMKISDV
jgi:hypothetical protein